MPLLSEAQLVQARAYLPSSSDPTTPRGFAAMLRRHWMLIALCIIVTVALAALHTRRTTPIYQATSVLRFESEQVNLPQLVQQLSTENRINTEIEVLRGQAAAAAVIDSLGLRAQLETPRRAQVSKLFSLLKVAPTTDTLTLVIAAKGAGSFGVMLRGSRGAEGPTSLRIGDTVQVAGVTLALARPAADAGEIRLRVVSLGDAVRSFESTLKVSRPARDVDLIDVQVRATDPVQVTAAANLLAQQLISGRQDVQMARTGSTVQFLKQQLDTLGTQLHQAEDTLRDYRERAGVVDAPEQARTEVARLVQLQADRGSLEAERDALATLVQQLRSTSGGASADSQAPTRRLMSFPSLFKNQATSQLLASLATLENQRSELLIRRTPKDPDVQALTMRIQQLDAQLQGIAETYLQGLTDQVNAMNGVAKGFKGALDSLPRQEVQTARLEQGVSVLQNLYTLIQTRLKEAEITQAMKDPTVRIVDQAVLPEHPIGPVLLTNVGLAIVLGALIGIAISAYRELTRRSVRSRGDALSVTGLPVLAAVPKLNQAMLLKSLPHAVTRQLKTRNGTPERGNNREGSEQARTEDAAARIRSLLVTRPEVPTAYVEALNQLFARVVVGYRTPPIKTLVFTSALPGEGKTISAINFALIAASRGLRVLLVDADLRCGLVNEVFDCPREPGFAELLKGTVRFEDAVRRIPFGDSKSLALVSSGARLPALGGMHTTTHMSEALSLLATDFDLVVIDSPPVNLLADAVLLGSVADAVLLIARAGQTSLDALQYAADALVTVGVPVIGTVLNDVDLRKHVRDDPSYRYLTEVGRYYAGAHG